MNLRLDSGHLVSDVSPADKAAYLEHLREKEIYDNTCAIPYPYTEADADAWIRCVGEEAARLGRSLNWAIRRPDGHLIGGIGFRDVEGGQAELGYWLAKPYWGRGIMTEAVAAVADFGFNELGLKRITARVFHFNAASARVLQKAGFRLEERLRDFYRKDGRVFDGLLYARRRG